MADQHPKQQMNPISHEICEVDGVYRNEWGREEMVKRGEAFPSDPQLGTATWELVSLEPKESLYDQEEPHRHKTRFSVDRGDK
ncbi:hypothetical protein [Marinicrinis sediminis]|uniref:Transposase n=1 Tax=Marinicrinis sediminis TaxID=1652465 RepID=A0ABW5R702_9BACL